MGAQFRTPVVPADAPIQPPQGFVDNIQKFITQSFGGGVDPDVSGQGLSRLMLSEIFSGNSAIISSLTAYGNALDVESVDDIFEFIVTDSSSHNVDVSQGTSASPTGGAINADVWTNAITNSGDSYFNLHGVPVYLNGNSGSSADFSGNAMTAAEVADLLEFLVIGYASSNWTLNLTGGTSEAPTGGAINEDLWTLAADNSWNLSFNLNGVTASMGTLVANFSGNSMLVADVNALLAFLAANYLSLGWTLNISGGTTAAPTGQGLIDKAALQGGGWTVTTN